MTDASRDPESELPTEEIEEPSTEKDPGEQPTAPADEKPDHQADGIGVIGTDPA